MHCDYCELFSHTMQLTHHTFKLNLGFLMNCGDHQLFSHTIRFHQPTSYNYRLPLWVYLGFIVHCDDCELFSCTMRLTHHTFKLNLGFLMNCGDHQLFSHTIRFHQPTSYNYRLPLWVYLGFIVHCDDCELFSCTMQLTHHTFKLNLGFLMNYGNH